MQERRSRVILSRKMTQISRLIGSCDLSSMAETLIDLLALSSAQVLLILPHSLLRANGFAVNHLKSRYQNGAYVYAAYQRCRTPSGIGVARLREKSDKWGTKKMNKLMGR